MTIDTEEAAARARYEAALAEMKRVLDSHYDQLEIKDFVAHLPSGKFIFKPTRDPWPAASVNAKIPPIMPGEPGNDTDKPMPATVWLKRHVCVEQTVWAPGQKEVIQNKLLTEDGFIDRPGCAAFNIYEPPTIELGDPKKAMEWLALVRAVFPDEKDTYEFISFGAHAVQRPWEKVNHALVMASRKQGIGKDTALEPIRYGVGLKNFVEVSPKQLMGRFNGFARSVVLRVSEAKDLGETNRFEFYDHIKVYAAAPPNVHRVDEKNTKEYSVLNCCHLII